MEQYISVNYKVSRRILPDTIEDRDGEFVKNIGNDLDSIGEIKGMACGAEIIKINVLKKMLRRDYTFIGSHRNFDCYFYDLCLSAVNRMFGKAGSFSCKECDNFDRDTKTKSQT